MGDRVVVVEDDESIRGVLVEALAGEGYAAVGFGDATHALDDIIRDPPSLVISDLLMPGMQGDELVRRIRAQVGAEIPVVIISASTNGRLVTGLPIQAFIGKPFDLDYLLRQVARYVGVEAPATIRHPH
ncbi:MAG: response regulator [Ktedonobacterales bacterium]|jgi:DNA-binding response OmpR family regulator